MLQLMKFVLALFLATCAFILFAFALSQSDENLARASILVPLIMSFLCLWYSLKCIAIVMLPMYVDIEQMVEKAKTEVLAKRDKGSPS